MLRARGYAIELQAGAVADAQDGDDSASPRQGIGHSVSAARPCTATLHPVTWKANIFDERTQVLANVR